jgi:hypothetical protein
VAATADLDCRWACEATALAAAAEDEGFLPARIFFLSVLCMLIQQRKTAEQRKTSLNY